MTVIVKICGLSTPRAVDAALEAGADMIGFVHFAASPRHVPFDLARQFFERAGTRAATTLLTVDAGDDLLAEAFDVLRPDFLQLHGHEPPERAAALRAAFGVKIIKALPIDNAASLSAADAYAGAADMLLFDARPPKGASLPGGNGQSFDWPLLRGFRAPAPWLLAGGLDAGNVAQALAVSGAPGVDVSSGVERAPGVKDEAKIAAFLRAARGGVSRARETG